MSVFELCSLLQYKYRKSENNECSFKMPMYNDIYMYTKTCILRTVLIHAHENTYGLKFKFNFFIIETALNSFLNCGTNVLFFLNTNQ